MAILDDIHKRFLQVFDTLERKKAFGTRTEAAKQLEVSPQQLTEILGGRNKVSVHVIHRLNIAFNVSLDYLITGRTPIFIVNSPGKEKPPGAPYYNIPAAAGKVDLINDSPEYIERYIDGGVRCDFWINVHGNSMEPRFHDKDIVGCKRIDASDLTNGKDYLIVDHSHTKRYLKKLYKQDSKTYLLTSENSEHAPFIFPVKDVEMICAVVAKLVTNPKHF